jgi:hypothetical protein
MIRLDRSHMLFFVYMLPTQNLACVHSRCGSINLGSLGRRSIGTSQALNSVGSNRLRSPLRRFDESFRSCRRVRKVYVEHFDGNESEIARDRVIALFANRGRFQVVEKEEMADAVLFGRTESTEVAKTVITSEDTVRRKPWWRI